MQYIAQEKVVIVTALPVTGVSANLFQHCRGSILAKQPKLIPLWFEGRWETEQCININQIMPIPMELQLFDSMG